MKKLVIGLLCFAFNTCISQKLDNNWLLGSFNGGTSNNNTSVQRIDFVSFPPTEIVEPNLQGVLSFGGYTVSDPVSGNLLFYTTGARIFRDDGSVMQGGDSINNNTYIAIDGDEAFRKAVIPSSQKPDEYWMFHRRKSNIGNTNELHRYTIDMSADNGKGAVIDRKLFYSHPLNSVLSTFSMTKHGNGRDWWMTFFAVYPNYDYRFLKFLITPDTIIGPITQVIGDHPPTNTVTGGAPFGHQYSHNGRLFVDYHFGLRANFFRHDRCTGEFSLLESVYIGDTATWAGGAVFSPDDHFCYVASGQQLYQYDVTAPNIAATRTWVGSTTYGSSFLTLQLAPDGRIYSETCNPVPNGPPSAPQSSFINYQGGIAFPNRRGLACKAGYDMMRLPKAGGYPPYHPNYRLGPLDGSPCDTLGLDNFPLAGFRWEIEDSSQVRNVTFTDLSWYEPTSWHWDFGDGTTSQDTSPVHVYAENGVYEVCLIVCNSNACDTLCQFVNIGVVSAETIEKQIEKLHFSPNPADQRTTIELLEPAFSSRRRLLFSNILGETVFETDFSKSKIEVSTVALPSGIYVVQFFENGVLKSAERLVVAH